MEFSPTSESYEELLREVARLRVFKGKIEKKLVSNFFKRESPALLPPLRKVGSFSEGSISKNKKERIVLPAKGIESVFPFDVIHAEENTEVEGTEISAILNRDSFLYGAESTVQGFVKDFIEDVMKYLKFGGQISVLDNLKVLGLAGDLWLLHFEGFTLAVVEVKKPSKNTIIKDQLVLGQLLDYLLLIQSFSGLKTVTDYDHWVVSWIAPDSDLEQREMYCSEIVSRSDPNLPHLIASFLVKTRDYAGDRSLQTLPLFDLERPYICVDGDGWKWSKLPNGLQLSLYPPGNGSTSYLDR